MGFDKFGVRMKLLEFCEFMRSSGFYDITKYGKALVDKHKKEKGGSSKDSYEEIKKASTHSYSRPKELIEKSKKKDTDEEDFVFSDDDAVFESQTSDPQVTQPAVLVGAKRTAQDLPSSLNDDIGDDMDPDNPPIPNPQKKRRSSVYPSQLPPSPQSSQAYEYEQEAVPKVKF